MTQDERNAQHRAELHDGRPAEQRAQAPPVFVIRLSYPALYAAQNFKWLPDPKHAIHFADVDSAELFAQNTLELTADEYFIRSWS